MERASRWWALWKTENITSLTEDPQPAMFLPILQSPSSETCLVVRSNRDPQQLAAAMRSTAAGPGCRAAFLHRNVERRTGHRSVSFAYGDGVAGCAGRDGRDAVDHRHLWNGCVLGQQAAAGNWEFAWPSARSARKCCRRRWDGAFKLLAFGSAAGLLLGILASRVLAYIVYQATPRDPLVLAGVVLAMLLLGLLATWIPAQRALSVDPVILLREE